MRISSNIAIFQVEEFIKVLRKNRIKKGSDEWARHLIMFGESRGVARNEPNFSHEAHIVAYKKHWCLS